MMGERLSTIISPAKLRLAAAVTILSPFIPMLFMGEEYGETAPFQYFTSHDDADLIEAVRKGRLEEFDDFEWHGEPPDPHDEGTFNRSKLSRIELEGIRDLYRELLRLRRETAGLRPLDLDAVETHADDERRTLLVKRGGTLLALNFSDQTQTIQLPFEGRWTSMLDTGGRVEGGRVMVEAKGVALFRMVA